MRDLIKLNARLQQAIADFDWHKQNTIELRWLQWASRSIPELIDIESVDDLQE